MCAILGNYLQNYNNFAIIINFTYNGYSGTAQHN